MVTAQVITPTNDSFTGTPPQFILQTNQVMDTSSVKIFPLTNDAGLAGSQQQLNVGLALFLSSSGG